MPSRLRFPMDIFSGGLYSYPEVKKQFHPEVFLMNESFGKKPEKFQGCDIFPVCLKKEITCNNDN